MCTHFWQADLHSLLCQASKCQQCPMSSKIGMITLDNTQANNSNIQAKEGYEKDKYDRKDKTLTSQDMKKYTRNKYIFI